MSIIIILHLCLLIQVTSEYGGSWSKTSAPDGPWISISSSSTGNYLVAAQGGKSTSGDIYISSTG